MFPSLPKALTTPLPCLLSLLALSWMPLVAEDQAPPPVEDSQPEVDETKAVSPAESLLKQIGGATPHLLIVDDQVVLQAGDTRFAVDSVDKRGRVVLTTGLGPVTTSTTLARSEDPAVVTTLAQLIALGAELAEDERKELMYDRSVLSGLRVRNKGILILPEGILRRQEIDKDRATDVAKAKDAADKILAKVDQEALGPMGTTAIGDVVNAAIKAPLKRVKGDEITPRFARQILRHGWLGLVQPDNSAAEAFIAATSQLDELTPYRTFTGAGGTFHELGDAFGPTAWLLATSERTALAVRPPIPEYHWPSRRSLPKALTVIDLPPGTDPIANPELLLKATRVQVTLGKQVFASWTPEGGLDADPEQWRRLFPASGGGLRKNVIRGYMPPHLIISTPAKDIKAIITAHGILEPPQADAGEAFLAHAAEVLPDAPHLDLIGQYLFKYVYDSPDPTRPLLVGTDVNNGDIHQTALETVATAHGGRCRGDCDDLSELYHNILERQGKIPHVITLPAHAAVAWAEEREDGWHTFVMQTGPSLEFVDQRLQDSLAKAYLDFDAADTFDPNGLGLSLRFSGENTRSSWRLSWRIFAEKEYAKTMIDVQRDWHYQTYLEGIRKMEELIAGGDEDTANYRELAGLANFTGQYSKAADYMKMAIERTEEATSRLFETAEYTHHLLRAERDDEAIAAIRDVIDRQLPALGDKLGPEQQMQYGMRLASFLIDEDQLDLAHEVLSTTADRLAVGIQDALIGFVQGNFDANSWRFDRKIGVYRRLISFYASIAEAALNKRGLADLRADQPYRKLITWLEKYQANLQMYEAEEPSGVLTHYASIGTTYAAILGDEAFVAMLETATSPTASVPVDVHRTRLSGLAQLGFDLPWIRVSPTFFAALLGNIHDADEKPDAAWIKRLLQHLDRAEVESQKLGLDSPFIANATRRGRLVGALLLEDEQALRTTLSEVKSRDDKRLRDSVVMTIGGWARHCTADWWATILKAWQEEVDYKPKYFLIAWQAVLDGAPEHGLAAADLAAERFKDDPTFVNERNFMHELFAEQKD